MSILQGSSYGVAGRGPRATTFADPFNDVASQSMPTAMRSVLYWAEHNYARDGTYWMALERVISYFLTEIEILNTSDEEGEKWGNLHDQVLNSLGAVQVMLRDRMCYGNGFASLLVPFKRFLCCPKCGFMTTLEQVHGGGPPFEFEWSIPDFIATCPVCKVGSGYRGKWIPKDEPSDVETGVKVKHWSPHQIELLHDLYSDRVDYLWRIPEDYKAQVRRGHLINLEEAPMGVIHAIHRNQMFRFDKGAIFHMKEPHLSGVVNRGWGIPRLFSNYRQLFYVQVLRRFNEAIALDYVIPFRVITPAPATGTTSGGMGIEPLAMASGQDFRSQILAMIRRRNYDPAGLNVLPFPVNFQMFGADANTLAPRDLLDQGQETLLNALGTPVELFKGSLQIQSAPPALRLFESTWRHLVYDANSFLRWMSTQVAQILSWEEVTTRLKRVTIADDMEKLMMGAQLMMSQQLSGTTLMRDLGYDWRQEQKQISEEARYQAELQARNEEEMQQSGVAAQMAKGQTATQGGQPPADGGAGGQPPPAGGDPAQAGAAPPQGPVSQYLASMTPNVPQTPQDMLAVADGLANDLLGLPEGVKDSELRKLKMANEVLHSLVKARMDQKRKDAKQQAGVGGGGGQPPPQ